MRNADQHVEPLRVVHSLVRRDDPALLLRRAGRGHVHPNDGHLLPLIASTREYEKSASEWAVKVPIGCAFAANGRESLAK